jgi:hypothetical protein
MDVPSGPLGQLVRTGGGEADPVAERVAARQPPLPRARIWVTTKVNAARKINKPQLPSVLPDRYCAAPLETLSLAPIGGASRKIYVPPFGKIAQR